MSDNFEAEKRAFVRASLRRATFRWKYRNDCLKKARIARGKYICNSCYEVVKSTEISADHIIPVIGDEGWVSYNSFIDRLLAGSDGWQALCDVCHGKKTQAENERRREYRKTHDKKRKKVSR